MTGRLRYSVPRWMRASGVRIRHAESFGPPPQEPARTILAGSTCPVCGIGQPHYRGNPTAALGRGETVAAYCPRCQTECAVAGSLPAQPEIEF